MISPLAITMILMSSIGGGAQFANNEYDVKAAFLVNFASFVEWPDGSFQRPDDPILICVLGQDPFGRALDDVAAGKSIAGRPIALRRLADARNAPGCRILFIHALDRKKTPLLSRTLPDLGVLTVGEEDGPAPESMIINFAIEKGRVRFSVNLKIAEREKLQLSSRLLGLASSVRKQAK
jgi:hypothetical protein